MHTITEVIRHFPTDLQDSMLLFWEVVKEELGVKREDFTELKNVVQELAEAQNRTERRVEELAEAQNRTEKRVEELAEAQNRTEKRVEELANAQNRTEKRVEELAEAQNRTEKRVEELAEAQNKTERSLQRLSETIEFKIGGLGRRWGIDSERSFKNGLAAILSETGYEVINYCGKDSEGIVFGRPSEVEIDIIIKGDKTIVVEIKSSVSKSDVYIFLKKGDFYSQVSGRKIDKFLIITPFIDDSARDVANQYNIIICDSIADIRPAIQLI